ncbi:pqn-89 [Pristionchus pacificus]|uniref:Pqn-89 n=1 Tax=Pristionchus pacificus TaxID=54126 RepID=A0A2A6C1I3_PRIPA|nr:pqn-89 [Pristionchus pacificus]|eukprot:PDM72112.1 pqn-89 [Pristionchus pacificus]
MRRIQLLLTISSVVLSQFQQPQPTIGTNNGPQIDRGQTSNNGPSSNGNSGFSHYQPYFGAKPSSAAQSGGSTSLQFAIRSYSDPGSRTPDGGVCHCPQNVNCGDEDRCSFTFTFIVATPNQKTEVYETTEIRLDANGDLPLALQAEWGRNFLMTINGRPSSLDILVHHRGLTYDDTGRPISASKLLLVDRFHIDLDTILPAVGGVQSMQNSNDYMGQIQSTRMSLSLSLACSGQLIGPDCDLRCNRSTTISNVASCKSEETGYFAICNWATNQPNQVENCQRCPWGVRDDTHCQDEDGGVLYPDRAGVVADDFRTATIVLSIVLFIVVCLLAALVIVLCMKTRKSKKEEEQLPGHNASVRSEGAAARPLLQQTRYSNDSSPPTPAPRHNTPSGGGIPGGVAVLPPKSALKKPPPPAYMGGSNSVNESANTSYSDVPRMMVSRSEVV